MFTYQNKVADIWMVNVPKNVVAQSAFQYKMANISMANVTKNIKNSVCGFGFR